MADNQLKNEAIYLRTVKKYSLSMVCAELGISKGTASLWLKGYTLPKSVIAKLCFAARKKGFKTKRKNRIARISLIQKSRSKFYSMLWKKKPIPTWIGKISECAVMLRLLLNGCEVYNSMFDGERIDFIIRNRNGTLLKLQVKTIKRDRNYHFCLPLTYGVAKKSRIADASFDFVCGYCLETDLAYVFSKKEVIGLRTMVSLTKRIPEQWEKINK